ncbi:MAG: hypothetical protein U0176_24620 [Bacteroidia bacterium]
MVSHLVMSPLTVMSSPEEVGKTSSAHSNTLCVRKMPRLRLGGLHSPTSPGQAT